VLCLEKSQQFIRPSRNQITDKMEVIRLGEEGASVFSLSGDIDLDAALLF
jgi:hypothetical protein